MKQLTDNELGEMSFLDKRTALEQVSESLGALRSNDIPDIDAIAQHTELAGRIIQSMQSYLDRIEKLVKPSEGESSQ